MRRGILLLVALVMLAPFGAHADSPPVDLEPITIGLHAPTTGPAPLIPAALEKGKDLYWKWLDGKGTSIHGRSVRVVFKNDNHNPTQAVAVCNDMATSLGALSLIGIYGTDQINSCASYAASRGIPYFYVGAQERGLATRSTAFALSASYERQAKTAAGFIAMRLGQSVDKYGRVPISLPIVGPVGPPLVEGSDGRVIVGLVRPNTPNFDGLESTLRMWLSDYDIELITYPTLKEGSNADASSIPREMRNDGIDVVVTATNAHFLELLVINAKRDEYAPRFISVGLTGGFDHVAQELCRRAAFDHASTFSPWPAWSERDEFDPDFQRAVDLYAPDVDPAHGADLMFGLWGLMKHIHAVLDAAGPDPNRDDVIAMLDAGWSNSNGVFPDVSFRSDDHLGADAAHRLEVDCTDGLFHEADPFVTGY